MEETKETSTKPLSVASQFILSKVVQDGKGDSMEVNIK